MDLAAMGKALESAVGDNDTDAEPAGWLDLGYPPLNHIISGSYDRGLPFGRIVEIFGPSASGKTLLATAAMIAAQRSGGLAGFVDWERTFKASFAEEMGLNAKFPMFCYKQSETWEQGNTVAMKMAEAIRSKELIPKEAPIVWVLDSVAAAVPKSMLYDKDGNRRPIDEYTMNDTTALARVTSTTLKAVNQLVSELNVVMIYLNQIRTKPGVAYGDPTTTPGGAAMEFYATARLSLGRKREMDKKTGEMLAADISIKTAKNKLCRPFQKTSLVLDYDDDGRASFDYARGMVEHMIAVGAIKKVGKMVEFDGKTMWESVLAKKVNAEGLMPVLTKMLMEHVAAPIPIAA
jgi:recombination protein RecA